MKRKSLFILIASVLLIAPAAYALAATQDRKEVETTTTTWEHLALPQSGSQLNNELGSEIIRLGNEGWELVCVAAIEDSGTTDRMIYYFKRPKN